MKRKTNKSNSITYFSNLALTIRRRITRANNEPIIFKTENSLGKLIKNTKNKTSKGSKLSI